MTRRAHLFALALLGPLGCADDPAADSGVADDPLADAPLSAQVLDGFDMLRVKADVDELADDTYGGRTPGSVGHAMAREYIVGELESIGVTPMGQDDGYLTDFELTVDLTRGAWDENGDFVSITPEVGTNIVGLLPGTDPELSDEYVVLMAHYDHLGVTSAGHVYNGAFDDITGVAMLLELARVWTEHGVETQRSVLLLITDAEEGGLHGSAAWLQNAGVDVADVHTAIAVDPVGRGVLPDWWPVVLLGAERSPELRAGLETAAGYLAGELDVEFVNRDPIPSFASDQDSFWLHEEPLAAVWFTSPGMTWYHTTDDTAETIDYRSVLGQSRYLALATKVIADDAADYTDLGPQPLSAADAADTAQLMVHLQQSQELDADELDKAAGYQAEFEALAADGDAVEAFDGLYLQAALWILFTLTSDHPGQVPPPFPE